MMTGYSPFGNYLGLSGVLFSAKREMEINQKEQQLQPAKDLPAATIRETLRRPMNTPSSTVNAAHSDSTCSSSDIGLTWPRPRYASWSSVDTDITDDSCVSADSCMSTPPVTSTGDGVNVDGYGASFRQRRQHDITVEDEDRDFVCVTGDSQFRLFIPNIPDPSGRPILPQKPESRPELDTKRQRHPPEGLEMSMGETIYSDDDFDRLEVLSSVSDVRSSKHSYHAPSGASASCMDGVIERFVTEIVERKFRDRFQRPTVCVFCQRNGETFEYYSTHMLKDNRGKVICPILRNYVCPKCNATGDNAHTLRHCPKSKSEASVSKTFKTPRTSCGLRKLNVK